MADEKRLNELLDLVEQARKEGDKETEQKATAAYMRESAPPKPQTMTDRIMALNPMLAGARDIGQGIAKFGSGLMGGLAGDAAGLGGIVADATGLAQNDPAAVRDFVASKLSYQPSTPSGTGKVLELPGRGISYLGEKAKQGVQSLSPNPAVQFAGDVAGAVPLGLASLAGIKGVPKFGRPVSVVGDTEAAALRSAPDVIPVESGAPGTQAIPTQVSQPVATAIPITAGQRLRSQGADITPGMAKPGGIANALETTFQRFPVIGELIRESRRAGNEGIQKVVIQRAAAPGATVTTGSPAEMLTQAYDSFGPLYDQAKGFPVSGASLENSFTTAAKNRNVQTTDATRASTADWLGNKLTELQPKPGKPLDSGQLIELRSDIRTQIRKNRLSGDPAKIDSADLMESAERAVTQSLESQLPERAVTTLRAADKQYGTYKIIENAVAKAKDNPAGFSAENLSQAIKEATEKGAYARGGGRLRQLAQDWKTATSGGAPQTGIQAPLLGGAAIAAAAHPLIAVPAGMGALALSTTKFGRRIAAGRLGNSPARSSRDALPQLPEDARAAIAAALTRQQQP